MLPSPLNPVDTSYLRFLVEDEQARQRAIRRARAYAQGKQFVALTERLRAFLSDDSAHLSDSDLLRLNVCHTVIRAVTERLIVRGFTSANEGLQTWAGDVWQRNRMDARADDAHEMAIRDGECFVLISWDNAAGLPRFMPHPRYVEAGNSTDLLDGDGYGIKAFYQDDDDNGTMLYAVKRWYEVLYADGKRSTRQRATVYYPNRVEKYEVKNTELVKIRDAGDAEWPLPWVDSAGNPLGIPVAHFKNANLSSEHWEAIPLQNAINKTLIDLLASSDMTAFRILIALGWNPVDEDGNPLPINPGSWLGTTNKDAAVQVVDGANLDNQLSLLDSLILKVAQATDTPVARFITTKSIAGEGTQKAQETPLLGKLRKRQVLFGNAWEDCFYIARKLHNTYSTQGALDEAALLFTAWEPASVRDEGAELDRALKKQSLGIPFEIIIAELDYDDAELAQMLQYRQQAEQRQVDLANAMPQQTGNTDTSVVTT